MGSKAVTTIESAPSGSVASLLDIAGVADALGITRRYVQRLVAERRIPFLKVGRFVWVDPAELNLWLDQQRVEAGKAASGARAAGR